MNFLRFYLIIGIFLLNSVIAVASSVKKFSQEKEVQPTLNIDKNEVRNSNNTQVLGNDEWIRVLIKPKNSRGNSVVQELSFNDEIQIEVVDTMRTTITRKDMASLEQNSDIVSIETHYPVHVSEDTTSLVRKLAESTPYGISMDFKNTDF